MPHRPFTVYWLYNLWELRYEKAVFWYYSNIVRKRGIADVLSKTYITIVLLWISQFFLFLGGRDDRDIFVLLLLLICNLTVLSPLFYIQLSYVAIKDDFCKNAAVFAFLWSLFCFLSFCPKLEKLYSPSASFLFSLPVSSHSFLLSISLGSTLIRKNIRWWIEAVPPAWTNFTNMLMFCSENEKLKQHSFSTVDKKLKCARS